MAKPKLKTYQPGMILLSIDPTSPTLTVIGFESTYNELPSPVGCGGAAVLAAIMSADFKIDEVTSGDTYVLYTLYNKKFKPNEQEQLEAALNALECEPVT